MLESVPSKENCIRAAADGDVPTLRRFFQQSQQQEGDRTDTGYLSAKGDRETESPEDSSSSAVAVQWSELVETLFREAIENGQLEVVRELLDSPLLKKLYCDTNARQQLLSELLASAISEDYSNIVECLLRQGADPNHPVTMNGESTEMLPLGLAARLGSLEIVQLLVQSGATVNARGESDGATALHEAARQNESEIIEYLIQSGADANVQDSVNGESALHVAVKKGCNNSVRKLLQYHANLSLVNKRGSCAVHLAQVEAQREMIKLLVAAGANPANPAIVSTPGRK